MSVEGKRVDDVDVAVTPSGAGFDCTAVVDGHLAFQGWVVGSDENHVRALVRFWAFVAWHATKAG